MCKTKPTPCKTALALAAREAELNNLRKTVRFQLKLMQGAIAKGEPQPVSSIIYFHDQLKAALNEQI